MEFTAQDLYNKRSTEISTTNIQSYENFRLNAIGVTGNMINTKATTDLNQFPYRFVTAQFKEIGVHPKPFTLHSTELQ
jgi:hypothetical protein